MYKKVINIKKLLIIISLFILTACNNVSDNDDNIDNNKDILIDNTPILGCNISNIDKYNKCNIYFKNGIVSQIELSSTYPNKEDLNETSKELSAVFDNVVINNLTLTLVINEDNDKYMEYIGMDKESISYICK